jgi:predicted amidohydrolase
MCGSATEPMRLAGDALYASVRVAICQLESTLGTALDDPRPANIGKALSYIERAHRAGATLVVFGEVFLTGYRSDAYLSRYATLLDGPDPSLSTLSDACRTHDVEVIMGSATRTRDLAKPYNSVMLIDGQGLRGVYHKTHLGINVYGADESAYFSAGSTLPVFTTRLGSTGLQVCRDNRFPEVSRIQALNGATAIVNISAPLAFLAHFWNASMVARAMENQVWYIFAPVTGTQGTDVYGVPARVISPRGDIIVQAGNTEEQMIVADIDPQLPTVERRRANVFPTRRTDLYHDLIDADLQNR